jgi:hypothetical protein
MSLWKASWPTRSTSSTRSDALPSNGLLCCCFTRVFVRSVGVLQHRARLFE